MGPWARPLVRCWRTNWGQHSLVGRANNSETLTLPTTLPYSRKLRQSCSWELWAYKEKEEVEKFTYLGSPISEDGNAQVDVKCLIGRAATVFMRMNKIWASPTISIPPTQLHRVPNGKTWKGSASVNNKLDVFEQRCLCGTLKIRYTDHITNEKVLRRNGPVKLHNKTPTGWPHL
uniref:Uncharacterized protein n=1 Tax=Romanomermis culicivorax TaxID=13658 RepID=A0A915II89_ROMCU